MLIWNASLEAFWDADEGTFESLRQIWHAQAVYYGN